MLNGSREITRQMLREAIEATKSAQDPVAKGVYALCFLHLAELEERNSFWGKVKCGPLEATGVLGVLLLFSYAPLLIYLLWKVGL
ncbi:MAG: hypothetical protein QXT73_01355 [Candidatus Methanomethylicaceae archaeon]